jgi:hypothetical protein
MTYHHRSPDPSPSPATAAIVPQAIVSLMVAFDRLLPGWAGHHWHR